MSDTSHESIEISAKAVGISFATLLVVRVVTQNCAAECLEQHGVAPFMRGFYLAAILAPALFYFWASRPLRYFPYPPATMLARVCTSMLLVLFSEQITAYLLPYAGEVTDSTRFYATVFLASILINASMFRRPQDKYTDQEQ